MDLLTPEGPGYCVLLGYSPNAMRKLNQSQLTCFIALKSASYLAIYRETNQAASCLRPPRRLKECHLSPQVLSNIFKTCQLQTRLGT